LPSGTSDPKTRNYRSDTAEPTDRRLQKVAKRNPRLPSHVIVVVVVAVVVAAIIIIILLITIVMLCQKT
jgi:type IV secretory pathway component VirB8